MRERRTQRSRNANFACLKQKCNILDNNIISKNSFDCKLEGGKEGEAPPNPPTQTGLRVRHLRSSRHPVYVCGGESACHGNFFFFKHTKLECVTKFGMRERGNVNLGNEKKALKKHAGTRNAKRK